VSGTENAIEDERVTVSVWPAHVPYDGEHEDTIVVQVDTSVDTGRLRVNVNDGTIWDGDPEKVDSPEVQQLKQTYTELRALRRAIDTAMNMADAMQDRVLTRARELDVKL